MSDPTPIPHMQFSRTNSVMLSCLLLIVISGCSRTQNNSSLALQSTAPSNANVAVVTQHENTATTTALVKSEKANLRDKPSRSGAIIKEVEKNDRLTLIEQSAVGPWYNVRENKTGSSGWIHGDVIVLNQVPTEVKPSAPQLATTPTPRPVVPTTSGRSYINVDGVRVPSPVFTDRRPEGATARCRDGSYSFSQHRQGTCSHHGGVAEWL